MNFDRKLVKRWRRDVWRVFADQGFKSPEIPAAMVLAAVMCFGTDLSVLSDITGSSEAYVRQVLRRLRQQGVLRGRTIRTAGLGREADVATLGMVLDAGVAAGIFTRSADPKRSAAQKARKPETRARGPRRPRTQVTPGALFTPALQRSNPLYGLPEWEIPKRPARREREPSA
ncbi:MAG: hypothetical protein Q8S13_11290 [Dehalococcoidia bacterium]|nr:hypothetical protein [Dehalococcoidia bacterium]